MIVIAVDFDYINSIEKKKSDFLVEAKNINKKRGIILSIILFQ